MTIAYAKTSSPSAHELERCLEANGEEVLLTSASGDSADINWGRAGEIPNDFSWGCLNSNISSSTDKLRMRMAFLQHGVPAPLLFEDPLDAYAYIEQGGSVVARTRTHTRHKGFWRCNTRAELDAAVLGGAVQFLAYVEAVREYRVHVFRTLSIRLNQKQWTNAARTKYTTIPADRAMYGSEIKRVRHAARAAIAATDLDFGAVDVLVDVAGQPYVCEVNAAPGLGGTTGEAYARAFSNWWDNEDYGKADDYAED